MLSLYCDGSGHAKPGLPGGWAFLIVRGSRVLVSRAGSEKATTNNRMEMTAAIEGLEALAQLARTRAHDEPVELVSDSRHTLDVAAGTLQPTKDLDLTQRLRALTVQAGPRLRWVQGHTGDVWNEQCDALAHEAKQSRVPQRVRRKQARRTQSKR